MRVLVIVGTQLRHRFFLSKIAEKCNVAGIIYYERQLAQGTKLPLCCAKEEDLVLEKRHFEHLRQKEEEYFLTAVEKFDDNPYPKLKTKSPIELNSTETISWFTELKADVIIDYGSCILKNDFLKAAPKWTINLHGGLSPYYKGSATLFWPFYFQQPELAGITYHLIDNKIDHGLILQHFRPEILQGDSQHDIGCRAISNGAEIGVKLLKKLEKTGTLKCFPQKSGKLFLVSDYKPSHLRVVYDLWKRGLIDNYLKNKELIDSKYEFVNQLDDIE